MRISMKLVLGLIGGALLVLAAGLAASLGAGFLHYPQPRTQLTVKIDADAVPQLAVRALYAAVRDGIREPRLGFASIAPSGNSIVMTISEGVERQQALARLQELSHQPELAGGSERFTIMDGGGPTVQLAPTSAAIAQGMAHAVDQTIDVLTHRLDGRELKPIFNRTGDDRIAIEVAQQPDMSRLKALIVAPGQLAFRFVDTSVRVDEAESGRVPPQSEILRDRSGTPFLVEKRVAMSGETLVDSQPGYDQRTDEPIVTFRFNDIGKRQFARITQDKVGVPMAVVLDGMVLAAPVIREPILGGSGQISGGFTVESANNLAVLLRSGALPAPLTIINERAL
jgi:preprotein translocase subunit SecD